MNLEEAMDKECPDCGAKDEVYAVTNPENEVIRVGCAYCGSTIYEKKEKQTLH